MRYRVLPYRQGSKSAKALADALGGRVLRLVGSAFVPRSGDLLINWGNTDPPSAGPAQKANYMDLRGATNKLNFFRKMKAGGFDAITPPFWENKNDIPDSAFPIVCRTNLAGHSGDGIVIANTRDELVNCSLYVQYMKKKDEYRIHVGMLSATAAYTISVQRKARRLDVPNPNWQVRNHQNGFIYAREGVTPPPLVIAVAHQALAASGLDFGAVDVIWNEKDAKAYVLEINTAPGLEGQTVQDYAKFFKGDL